MGVILTLIVVLILTSSVIYVLSNNTEEPAEDNTNNDTDSTDPKDDDKTDDGSDQTDDPIDDNNPPPNTQNNFIFVEDASLVTCAPCVEAGMAIKEIYDEASKDFYYVSMVSDKNDVAKQRLEEDLNLQVFPTVYIDGGYRVIKGSTNFEEVFNQALNDAGKRHKPNLYLNFTSFWDEDSKELESNLYIENYEEETYSGKLKIYITEKLSSRWSDAEGNPYHYAFLDYAEIKDIEVLSNSNITFTSKWASTDAGFSDVYPQNLYVIAVIFNSSSEQRYSLPDDNEAPFDAYFVDSVTATSVSEEGTLPPAVGISSPQIYHKYIFGNDRGKADILLTTILIGKSTIELNIQAEAGVEKVEYKIENRRKQQTFTITEEPFELELSMFSFGKIKITATVYDNEGRTASDELELYAFMLGI